MKISDIVFTDHSIKRMKERGISGEWAFQTVKSPDERKVGKEKSTYEFTKKLGTRIITAIAKKNDIGEWVILSVWIDPPFEGTNDSKKRKSYLKQQEKIRNLNKKMSKAGFWGKLWITFRKQVGF